MIPDVMQLLTFCSVCPASTATAERSFSHLHAAHQELPVQHYVAAEARLTDAALRLSRDGGQPEH